MIAYVKGILEYIADQSVVVDVHGIGYLVQVSHATIGRMPSIGKEVKLFTYLQVKEDGQSLHGFLTQEEVQLFMLLISVSGIGPKAAAAILAALTPSQIMIAIVADDAVALSKAPGVGKKTAQRLILELRDKIKTEDTWKGTSDLQATATPTSVSNKQDAMDAMLALGYGRTESMQVVLEVAEDGMSADQIIKLALKKLARGQI